MDKNKDTNLHGKYKLAEEFFDTVKPGHTVHYLNVQGQTRKGRVVMNKGTHLVLNRGNGQPQVVTPRNFVKVVDGTRVTSALLSNLAKAVKDTGGRLKVKESTGNVFDKHQKRIALDTLKMPDAMVGVMGGPSKKEARDILKKFEKKQKTMPAAFGATLSMKHVDKQMNNPEFQAILKKLTKEESESLSAVKSVLAWKAKQEKKKKRRKQKIVNPDLRISIPAVKEDVVNEETVNELKTSTLASVATIRYNQAKDALKKKNFSDYANKMKKAIKAGDATVPKKGWSTEDDDQVKEETIAEISRPLVRKYVQGALKDIGDKEEAGEAATDVDGAEKNFAKARKRATAMGTFKKSREQFHRQIRGIAAEETSSESGRWEKLALDKVSLATKERIKKLRRDRAEAKKKRAADKDGSRIHEEAGKLYFKRGRHNDSTARLPLLRKREWMANFEKHVVSQNEKHAGKIDWDTAHHMFNTGREPKEAADKYVSIKKSKLNEISVGSLVSYTSKAIADRKKARGEADKTYGVHVNASGHVVYDNEKMLNRLDKREKGIKTAVKKIANRYSSEKSRGKFINPARVTVSNDKYMVTGVREGKETEAGHETKMVRLYKPSTIMRRYRRGSKPIPLRITKMGNRYMLKTKTRNEEVVNENEELPPVHQIARGIKKNWKKMYFGAVPYVNAMHSMETRHDNYGDDSGHSIIAYGLSNMNSYSGKSVHDPELAKLHRAQLKAHLKAPKPVKEARESEYQANRAMSNNGSKKAFNKDDALSAIRRAMLKARQGDYQKEDWEVENKPDETLGTHHHVIKHMGKEIGRISRVRSTEGDKWNALHHARDIDRTVDTKKDAIELVKSMHREHVKSWLMQHKGYMADKQPVKEGTSHKARAYDVHLRGKHIDTVWFTGYDTESAKKSLINHDGYHPDIKVYDRDAKKRSVNESPEARKTKAKKYTEKAITLAKEKKRGKTANVKPVLEVPRSNMSAPTIQGTEGMNDHEKI